MSKDIVIAGGGISGLTTLHYLKKKFAGNPDVKINLYEKEDFLGGTIHSIRHNDSLFEMGPNGFLDSSPRTLELIQELNLEHKLLRARGQAQQRFLSVENKLHLIPMNPKSFLNSKLLNPLEKARVLLEIFIPRGQNREEESVYEFGQRRLGKKFAHFFLDPMISGIYGGDAQKINFKQAFPRMYALETQHRSLFKAMRQMKKRQNNGASQGMFKKQLHSFVDGMGQIIETLSAQHQENIHPAEEVKNFSLEHDKVIIETRKRTLMADKIFLSTPAYRAADVLQSLNPKLAEALDKINYAPIAVVGLVFPEEVFLNRPHGFGYLIHSFEKKKVLGVLFESDIFDHRAGENKLLVRVMMGGVRYPEILGKSSEELLNIALQEIQNSLGVQEPPEHTFFAKWTKAIPQYDQDYLQAKKNIEQQLGILKNFYLVANYWGGVSFNDCIENAYQTVEKFEET